MRVVLESLKCPTPHVSHPLVCPRPPVRSAAEARAGARVFKIPPPPSQTRRDAARCGASNAPRRVAARYGTRYLSTRRGALDL